ncbi:MAG: hypothetical protein PHN92_04825 [Geobacter sp.]|nr:hypothetical protein [Geobacter sp.]
MGHPAFTANIFDAPDDEIICWCANVTKGTVCDTIANGITTLDGLHTTLGILRGAQCAEKSPRGRCCCQEVVAILAQSALCRARQTR